VVGVLTGSIHAGLVVADWAGACGWCVGILSLELIAVVFVLWKLTPYGTLRHWTLGVAATAGGLFGGLAVPGMLYAGCPDAWREPPRIPEGSSLLVLFLEPGCSACEQLEARVLARYRGRLEWTPVSRCTAKGRALLRAHEITSFPTLVVKSSNDQAEVRITGLQAIERELRNRAGGEQRRESH
jgi:hypothetical protein